MVFLFPVFLSVEIYLAILFVFSSLIRANIFSKLARSFAGLKLERSDGVNRILKAFNNASSLSKYTSDPQASEIH